MRQLGEAARRGTAAARRPGDHQARLDDVRLRRPVADASTHRATQDLVIPTRLAPLIEKPQLTVVRRLGGWRIYGPSVDISVVDLRLIRAYELEPVTGR